MSLLIDVWSAEHAETTACFLVWLAIFRMIYTKINEIMIIHMRTGYRKKGIKNAKLVITYFVKYVFTEVQCIQIAQWHLSKCSVTKD